ncbi:MAG: IS200/IS605 family transposase [Planctomycetes bacterium]|nr:IS200/IS605 family transposase [Planctomycetota bacterium]
MPQSLSAIYVHLIFSTKNRERLIHPEIEEDLRKYLAGILRKLDSPMICSGGVEDHIHILFRLGRRQSISEIVEELKTGSSKWMKEQGPECAKFYWQNGYGAFSVSQSGIEEVKKHIANQRKHHRRRTLQEEFRAFLKKYEIEFDERYVWD